jgi:hypothetical protein
MYIVTATLAAILMCGGEHGTKPRDEQGHERECGDVDQQRAADRQAERKQ